MTHLQEVLAFINSLLCVFLRTKSKVDLIRTNQLVSELYCHIHELSEVLLDGQISRCAKWGNIESLMCKGDVELRHNQFFKAEMARSHAAAGTIHPFPGRPLM